MVELREGQTLILKAEKATDPGYNRARSVSTTAHVHIDGEQQSIVRHALANGFQ